MQLNLLQAESAAAPTPPKSRPADLFPDSPAPHEDKAPSAFRTISEAAELLGVPQHVLRFWESRFSQIKPLKRSGGRRFYRPEDMEILATVKHLLYKQGYTIKGAKKAFQQGKKPAAPRPAPARQKPGLSDKQFSQLSVIRQELIGLRETLRPYV